MRKAHIGHRLPETIKNKISKSMTGRKLSNETKHKLSQIQKNRAKTPEWREKIRAIWRHKRFNGEKTKRWAGIKRPNKNGYVLVYELNHPNADIGGRVLEHRLVMEKILGRHLKKWEIVHHKNSIKNDNRPENLEIIISRKHYGEIRCPYCLKIFKIK